MMGIESATCPTLRFKLFPIFNRLKQIAPFCSLVWLLLYRSFCAEYVLVESETQRRDGNEDYTVSDGKTNLLAVHFSTKQSQRCIIQRGSARKTQLGLAKGHLFAASFA